MTIQADTIRVTINGTSTPSYVADAADPGTFTPGS